MVDILIIGAGGAGLTSALLASQNGASVLVVGKSYPTASQTSMAQGGINASLSNMDEDSIESHIADTIKSAHGLCDEQSVRDMCSLAPETMQWLDSIGVPFSRLDTPHEGIKSIAQRKLGGATHKRACYAQDYTGLKILHTLYDNAIKEDIEFRDNYYLLNLIVEDGVAKGAIFLDIYSGEVVQIDAKSVIMATGGYASIYHGYTTNSFGSTGDGIASVLRAGGGVSDMEFVQFHPTALKSSSILISESARGEGGYLLDSKGERFIDELKPRDEVARAIFNKMKNGENIFLDIRGLGEEKLQELLPQEVALCKFHENIDPAKELIPIKPVAHYTMGGIDVDYTLEVNGIKGCFAVGECANAKIHGANRLGGNSLLEIISLGRLAGENASKYAIYASNKKASSTQLEIDKNYIESLFNATPSINFYDNRNILGELFYEEVGIIRDNKTLHNALERVIDMQITLPQMGINDKNREDNSNLIDFLEFRSALILAPTIISSAIARDESRGAHFKQGFESEDDANFKKHIIISWRDKL
ncbi:MAG: FAD-dependent oxidoreductase [Sulfurovum sp.]